MEKQIRTGQLLDIANESLKNAMYHVLPGSVVNYDAANQVADIQPMVNDVRTDVDTQARVSEPFEVIPSVPIMWPRFGKFVIAGRLNQYDPVLLIAFDLDPTAWRQKPTRTSHRTRPTSRAMPANTGRPSRAICARTRFRARAWHRRPCTSGSTAETPSSSSTTARFSWARVGGRRGTGQQGRQRDFDHRCRIQWPRASRRGAMRRPWHASGLYAGRLDGTRGPHRPADWGNPAYQPGSGFDRFDPGQNPEMKG